MTLGSRRRIWMVVFAASVTACGSDDSSPAGGGGGSAGAGAAAGQGGSATGGASGQGGSSAGGTSGQAGSSAGGSGGTSGQGGSAGGTGGAAGTWWKPDNAAPQHFHWQLSDVFAYPNDVVTGHTVYDIDGDLNTADTVVKLHGAGFKAICYMEVGSVEDFRDDYQDFVDAGVVGGSVSGWPGEYWLDISTDANIAKILPLMKKRMVNWCQAKGFDAIEPDTSDVEGAPHAQMISYNKQIADMAHSLGLGIGLKNHAGTDLTELEPYYDWSLVEQCWEYSECDTFVGTFLAHNKPVWNVEYNVDPDCAQANAWHMTSMKRDLDLVGPSTSGYLYEPCLADSQSTW
jgi:hypothetical protein